MSEAKWREKVHTALPKGSFVVDRRYTPLKIIGIGLLPVLRALCC